MKFNTAALIFILVASEGAYSASTCQSLFSADAAGSKSYLYSELIFDTQREPHGDGYTKSEHRENFWGIHDSFGFVSEARSTYLLAKSSKVLNDVVQNLKTAKTFIDGVNALAKITPQKNQDTNLGEGKGVLADVTPLIPLRFTGLNEYYPSRNGPNCWNLALYFSKVSFSLHETLPQEFKFFIESPLAKKLTSVDRLEPGDVLVFRNGTEEVHTAILLSPDLVLTKNGTDETRPYRIMELNEMAAQYLNPHPVYEMRLSDHWFVVRLSPLDKYVTENRAEIPPKLLAVYQELKALEEKINISMLPDSTIPTSRNEILGFVKAFQEKNREALESEKAFLSTAIQMRLESLRSF